MATVDEEAAQQDLERAAELNKQADQLVDTADTLRTQAARLEREAEELIAPEPLAKTGR